MKNSLRLFLLSGLFLMCTVSSAFALPFLKFGAKVGYGTSFFDEKLPSSASVSNFAAGAAAQFSLLMLQIEANVLYQTMEISTSTEVPNITGSLTGGPMTKTVKSTSDFSTINIPVIARFDFSFIPLLNLSAGTGYEQRVFVSATQKVDNNVSSYIPFSLMAMVNIPALVSLGAELRYSYQLTAWNKNGGKADDFMIFGTLLF